MKRFNLAKMALYPCGLPPDPKKKNYFLRTERDLQVLNLKGAREKLALPEPKKGAQTFIL